MQRDSQQWWSETKRDPERLRAWLFDQYRGEASAGARIDLLRETFAQAGGRADRVLRIIAAQERKHAGWIAKLLRDRNEEVVIEDKEERYWPKVMQDIGDLKTACAVGAHAERMRLERIETISKDPDAPCDVRDVFQRILPEERFHARAFAHLAGREALRGTEDAHALGRRALGLLP